MDKYFLNDSGSTEDNKHLKMLFYFFIFLIFSCVLNVPVNSVISYKNTLQEAGDLMVEHLIDKYKNTDHAQFFHPHVSEPIKDDNREVVKISGVEKFTIHGHYKQWKHTRLGLNNYVLGLSNSSLDIYSAADLELIHSIRSNEKLITFTAFTKWDEEYYRSEMIIVIGTSKPGIVAYRATKDEIRQLGYWPLNYQVKDIEPCQALVHTQLLLIPASASTTLELYSLDTSFAKSNFLFSQRLDVHGLLSASCFDVVPMQSLIAVSQNAYSIIKVYSFESSTGLYAPHQDIRVENSCVHLISFSLSYKNFLGCVPDPHHHIQFFSHNGGKYSIANSLGNYSAVVAFAASIENYRDETILFIQDIKGDTHILSYDGIKHMFQSGYDCKPAMKCLPVVDLSKGSSYQRHDGTAIYISPSDKLSGNSTILVVYTKIEYGTHSPIYRQSRLLYEQFEKVQKDFEMWRVATTGAVGALENALDLSGDNIVTGHWKLTKNLNGEHIVLQDDHTDDSNGKTSGVTSSMKKFVFINQNWEERDFYAAKEFDKIQSQLTYLKENLGESKHIMSDALLKNSSETQIVKSPTIVKGHFTSSEFHGNNIWVDRLWEEENTTQFLNSLYLTDSLTIQQVKGMIVFEKPLSMNSMNVEYYNGVRPENVARLSADNIFKSPVEFQHKFTVTGNVYAPTVGGHDLNKELIMINDVRDCKFEDGLVTRETKIDDLNFKFDNILLKSTDQEFKSHISFEKVRTKNAHAEKINGHAFKPFVDNIVLQDYGGMINGSTQILGTLNCNKISSINTLNNVAFPHGYVKNNQPVVHMTGVQNFSHINADKVYIDEGLLNGININKMWVGLSSPTKINSTWVFSDRVTILRNMNVTGEINGIDLNVLKFNEVLNQRKERYVINSDVEFTKPIVFNNLDVKSKINGKTHNEMFDGILIFDGKECHIPHETELADSLYVEDLQISTGEINTQSLNSLVTLNTAQNISGHMTMAKETSFHELHTEGINSIPLSSFFDRTIRISNPGIIDYSLHFENIWSDGHFNASGAINGHHTYRTLAASKTGAHPQVFKGGRYIFDRLACDDLEVTNNLNIAEGKKIGEVDLIDWHSSRLRLDSDQRISSPVIFHGSGTAMKNINVENINGVSLHDLERNSLRKDSNTHNFSTTVKANKIHVNGKILWKEHVSGHSLDEINHNALPINSHEPHTINSDWEFKSMTITGDLIVHGNTCGANIQYLNDDLVRKGENNVQISAEKIFKDTVNVKYALNTNSVNGNANFFRNLISLNDSSVKIDGHITFGKNLIVKKDLHMDEVNDISFKNLCNTYSFDNDNTHVIRRDVFAEELVGHNLEVKGLYQNQNISESLSNIVKTTGPPMKIYGDKVFTEPVDVRGDLSAGRVNDIDVVNLAKSVIMTNQPHAFSVPVHLKNVEADHCLVNNQMEAKHLPHDYNLAYLAENAIYINGHFQGNDEPYTGFHFQDVTIEKDFHANEINGIPIENYIRLNDGSQFIPNLVVDNARFSGPNVFVRNHVGGLNLPKEYSNTLMDDSPAPQHVTGNTFFKKHIEVKGNFVCANEEFPQSVEDVVTMDHNHTIYGPVVFQKPLHVKDMVVTQKVSGYTMDQYLSEPLTYDGEQEIPATCSFSGGVTFEDDIGGKGNLDGYDLKTIIKEIKYNASLAEKVVEKDLKTFKELCSRLDSITKDMAQTSMKLDYFDAQQNIILRKHVHKIATVQTQGKTILLMFDDDCGILKYNWNHEEEFFYELQPGSLTEHKLGQVKGTQSFSWNGEGFLIYRTEMSDCAPFPHGLYIISIDRTGKLSVPKLITNSSIVDFKIIDIRGNLFMFVITERSNDVGQEVVVYSWHSSGKFVAEQYLYLQGPLLQLEIAEFQRGIACLFQTRYGIFTYYYTTGSKLVSLIGFTEYPVKQNSSMLIFNSHGTLFMIVQERGAEESLIQPSCNLQVFRIYNGKIQRLQNLPAGEVISTNLVQFSDKEILISVISNRAPLKLYKFMGLSGLQPFHSNPVKIFDAKQIDFFNVKPWMSRSPRPFFVILGNNVAKVYRSIVFGGKMEQSYEKFKNICQIK